MRETINKRLGNCRGSLVSVKALWDPKCQRMPLFTSLSNEKISRSSIEVLWLSCKVATVHTQPNCQNPILVLNKGNKPNQQGITTCTWPFCPEELQSVDWCPRCHKCYPSPTNLPKLHGPHSLHRGCFHTSTLLQDWEG